MDNFEQRFFLSIRLNQARLICISNDQLLGKYFMARMTGWIFSLPIRSHNGFAGSGGKNITNYPDIGIVMLENIA